jgi:outer membrane immunogenic protein
MWRALVEGVSFSSYRVSYRRCALRDRRSGVEAIDAYLRRLEMKKLCVAATALAAVLSAPALAADLPSMKGPPPVYAPPPPLWTGFYVGLNAGYTFGGSDSVYVATYPGALNPLLVGNPVFLAAQAAAATSASGILSPTTDGFIGGGQIGYNWQFNNSFVVGIEADIQGAGARGSAYGVGAGANPLVPPFGTASTLSVTKNLDYLGTVRGRLGWLFTPTLLAYATGGLAYGGVKTTVGITSGDGAVADCVEIL